MENKFCANCGGQMDAAATFCPHCGAGQTPAAPTPIQQYNMAIKPKNSLASKIDIKATILSNIIPVACLVVGLVLLSAGLGTRIPSSYISSYSMTEYVGGDAYNFIVEAALRGGKIAGATVTKSLYIAAGLVIACVSALKINVVKPEKEN